MSKKSGSSTADTNNRAEGGNLQFNLAAEVFEAQRPVAGRVERNSPVLRATGLHKSFFKGKLEIPVLNGVDFEAREGEVTAIMGQSGSGKSTLLHLLATLDDPTSGEIHFGQRRIDNLPTRQRDKIRNKKFGMIFQFYYLLPELTTLENVLTPCMIADSWLAYRFNRKKYRARAEELLDMVGLSHRLKHRPRELSGGEMQRAAIARALISEPEILLADEPTGNLDQANGQEILKILRTLNTEQGLTIIMVTHDRAIADKADHCVRLVNGHVEVVSPDCQRAIRIG